MRKTPRDRRLVLALAIAIAGCSDRTVGSEGDGATTGAATTDVAPDPGVTTAVPPEPPPRPDMTTATPEPPPAADTSDSGGAVVDEGGVFLPGYDAGGPALECDFFAQDCPVGEKCVPWANDGGMVWNATRCVPVVRDPAAVGEACAVEDHPLSGADDCDVGLVCWSVGDDLVGYCEDLCGGSLESPTCSDAGDVCVLDTEGAFAFCLAGCHPLLQDCAVAGEVCFPYGNEWACAPDVSEGAGVHGEPCESVDGCAPGHVCAGVGAFTSCEGAIGCCTVVCDVDDASADAMCAALDPGQSCESWYGGGGAPDGYENVGVCALPG